MTDNSTSSARLAPPVGGFQEIEGRRIFVHRSGSGGPAVVFLPGASAVGLDYFGVQQEVSRFSTAVVYDRGGTGYSDPVPLPRTATAVATELRELLRAEGVAAPFVLVPHSLGGFYAHRFAQLYPQDVAGLVWLDALHRDWDTFMPPEAKLAAVEQMGPDAAQLEQMRPALRRMRAELLADYPEHVRQALVDAKASDEWTSSGIAERTGLASLAAELLVEPGRPRRTGGGPQRAGHRPRPASTRVGADVARDERGQEQDGRGPGQRGLERGTAHHLRHQPPPALLRPPRCRGPGRPRRRRRGPPLVGLGQVGCG